MSGKTAWFVVSVLAFALGTLVTPGSAVAIPVHAHGDDFTSWERDGDKGGTRDDHDHSAPAGEQGDTAHQHYIDVDFKGDNNLGEPFSAFGVWDDRTAFVDRDDPLGDDAEYQTHNVPHGYIRDGFEPRYRFIGDWSSAPAMSAMPLVVDAFDLWGAIGAHTSPETGQSLMTGVGFDLVTSGAYEIGIEWIDLPDNFGGGQVTSIADGSHDSSNPIAVQFDSSFDWDFTKDGSAADLNKWHFFSVVLHETGHTLLLEHQSDNDLMDPTVGEPSNNDADGDGNLWRWHALTDNAGENDFLNGYTRPAGVPGAWAPIQDKDSVDAVKSLYSIPIPEPSTLLLVGFGVVGLFALRRRCARR